MNCCCISNVTFNTIGASARMTSHDTANVDQRNTVYTERSIKFKTGSAFYRAESSPGRDLAVLAASLCKQAQGSCDVLDVMAGCGIRGVRYLVEGGVDSVWCNDYDSRNQSTLKANLLWAQQRKASLSSEASAPSSTVDVHEQDLEDAATSAMHLAQPVEVPGLRKPAHAWRCEGAPTFTVSHVEATRLMAACALNELFFDIVDVDSFGADSSFIGPALESVKYGGLVYLTCTAGMVATGILPDKAVGSYGCYTRAMPFKNEQGLRMLIGAAVKEGATRGLHVTPMFSLFTSVGPVFRVMLRVKRSKSWARHHYKFIAHCFREGHTTLVDWRELGQILCSECEAGDVAKPPGMVVSGPMWTGPLHDHNYMRSLMDEAERQGWEGRAVNDGMYISHNTRSRPLAQLLSVMCQEADPQLHAWHFTCDDIGKYGRLAGPPPRDALIQELRNRGFSASPCHLHPGSIRSGTSMANIVMAATEGLGIAIGKK